MSKKARILMLTTMAALGAIMAMPLVAIANPCGPEGACKLEDYCSDVPPPCHSVRELFGISYSLWTTEHRKALQQNFRKFDKRVPINGDLNDPLTLKILKDKVGPSFDKNKTPGSVIIESLKKK